MSVLCWQPGSAWGLAAFGCATLTVATTAVAFENDLSGDVVAGSPVVNIEPFAGLTVALSPYATPEPTADPLSIVSDLVFDAQGRGYAAQLNGTVRFIDASGSLAAAPAVLSDDLTDPINGRDIGMTAVALHPDFLNVGTPGYGKLYTVESGIGNDPTILKGDPAGVDRLPASHADFAPTYGPTGIDIRFKANTNHYSGVFEYTLDPNNPTAGVSAKREVLLTFQPHHAHNLGDLLFDPRAQPGDDDYGLLYISNADGGNGTGYQNNSNGLGFMPGPNPANNSVFGRILRIDPLDPNAPGVDLTNRDIFLGTDPDDREGDAIAKFSVPTGPVANPLSRNPNALTGDDLVWAFGLRNPYRIYIDPEEPRTSTTIWASETGQQNVEGIRTVTAGGDGGWGVVEGGFFYVGQSSNKAEPTLVQGLTRTELENLTVTVATGETTSTTRSLTTGEIDRILQVDFPDFQYDHTDGVSPMAGLIYRGDRLDPLEGMFLFAEFQGDSASDLVDVDGRTIGDQAILLVANPDDPLGQIFALSTRLGQTDVPDRILGFAEAPDGEALVYGFNLTETGVEGVIYRLDVAGRVIPEPAALIGLTGFGLALRRRR
ncbi:MAG: PQQ-dependent sugar dehydrogenase [Planctomycetota bacterium]